MRTVLAILLVATPAAAAPCPTDRWVASVIDGKVARCKSEPTQCVVDDHGWRDAPAPKDRGDVIANEDGTLSAVVDHDKIAVSDVKTGKVLTTITGWKSPMDMIEFDPPMFVGTSILVWEHWSPVSSSGRAYDGKTGKLIATFANVKDVECFGPAIKIDDKTWAISGFYSQVWLVDAKTWKTKKVIKLTKEDGPAPLLGKLADGRLVMQRGQLTLIDPATGKSELYKAPACAK